MAMAYRVNPKQIYKILKDNDQLSQVRTNILRRKARELIIQNSNAAEPIEEESDSDTQVTDSKVAEKKVEGEQNLFEE